MKPYCVISCPIDTFSGYGHRSRDLVQSLIKVKGEEWDIKILPQKWGETPWGYLDKNDPLRSRFIYGLDRQPEIWFQVTIPNEWQRMAPVNIGVTAGIETTKVAPAWLQNGNAMDKIITISLHSKETYE